MHLLNVALITILAVLQLLPAAQLLPAEVRPEQDSYTIAAGAETTIVVRLENATGVYGIDVRAAFDPALLEVVDADATAAGVQVEPGSFPQPDFVAANTVDPAAGTIRYVVTQLNPTPPATGDGVLFIVRLRGRGASGAAEFRIEQVEMSDRDGQLLPVNGLAATVEVAGSVLTGAGATPTGVALAPTTAAAKPTPATPATAAVQATATTGDAPPAAATEAPAATQPAAQTVTPAPQVDDQGSAADPAAPSPTTAAPADQPAVATAAGNVVVSDTGSESVTVAPADDGQAAPEQTAAPPVASGSDEAIADAAVTLPPRPTSPLSAKVRLSPIRPGPLSMKRTGRAGARHGRSGWPWASSSPSPDGRHRLRATQLTTTIIHTIQEKTTCPESLNRFGPRQ